MISGLTLHAWLLIEMQLKGVVLNKLDKNNDPIKKHFLINLSILYILYNIIFFQ